MRVMPASQAAVKHIGHGSQVAYSVHPARSRPCTWQASPDRIGLGVLGQILGLVHTVGGQCQQLAAQDR